MEREFLKCRDRDNLQDLMKTCGQFQSIPGDRHEQVSADRRPNLNGDAVGRVREEATKAQMLFDRKRHTEGMVAK